MESVSEYGQGRSVGQALENNTAFSVNHPFYRALMDTVERRVSEFASEKGQSRVNTRVSLATVALDSVELGMIAENFPEFKVYSFAAMRPAHAYLTQFRRMAVEWLIVQAEKLACSAVVLGSPLVAAIESSLDKVVLVSEPTSPFSVNEKHTAGMDAWRVYSEHVALSSAVGCRIRRDRYDEFLRGNGVSQVSGWDFTAKGDVLCVDGLLYALSPVQVALAMVSTGADVAMGFFPYHPAMLLDVDGEVPGFGFSYSRTDDRLAFSYSEGVAGVSEYPLDSWRAWLVSHTFSQGRASFKLELLKNRGCLMFYRMVKVPRQAEPSAIVHSFEVASPVPMYVITSYRLKSLSADVALTSSWRKSHYMVSARLVDRVYQFALQLPREQFTRYAIEKQISVVNDRVVIEGTSVRVTAPLGMEMLAALAVDVYARAFVDRYEMGRLTVEAKKYADKFGLFPAMSFLQRLWFVACVCVVSAWDGAFGASVQWLRGVADTVRGFLNSSVALELPRFDLAPSYVLSTAVSRGLIDVRGGAVVAQELTRRAALGSVGLFSSFLRSGREDAEVLCLEDTGFRVSGFALFADSGQHGGAVESVLDTIKSLNCVDEPPTTRRALEVLQVSRQASTEVQVSFSPVADPVYVLNEAYSDLLPAVAEQNLEFDTASLSLDPQDRTLMAPYMRLPRVFGEIPRPRAYYKSRLRALNVPKRQNTLQELVSAIAARNLSAPQVALPQDDSAMAVAVWENFLAVACHDGAKDLLRSYATDVVSLEEEAFREWAAQSTPDKLAAVKRELEEESQALGEMDVGDYMVMLKSDFKPTMSLKPLNQRTEPQVIVYHKKAMSALYSSVFRVLVRRFLALLRPNYHVNLLKDTKDMEAFVRGAHPFGVGGLQYLENDFSKYDKSQGRFVFLLEEFVFKQLGLNASLLERWVGGHVECSLRSVALGLSLHVLYQRKSGDATTAFGNVMLNIMSTSYAYRGTEVVWALFMGDDSLVCARGVAHEDDAVRALAEVFNLGAKTYLTLEPYFASNFVLVDDYNRLVHFVPDPVKRIERWSMSVSADDPQWRERYVSAVDSMSAYLNVSKTVLLPKMVAARYDVKAEAVAGMADAVATLLSEEERFRSIWEERFEVSNY